jgi:5-methylcytosine-specific restriction endonuclease McrA
MTSSIPSMKTCPKCGEAFPTTLEFWYKHKTHKDGLRSSCKKCHNKYSQRYYEAHAEERREYNRYWRDAHTEEIGEYQRRWHEQHLEHLRRYREQHLENKRVNNSLRRARKQAAEGSYTAAELQEQYKRQKGKCHWCGCKLPKKGWHPDHVIPLVRGGSNYISNIVCSCAVCNLSKHNKLPHEWDGTDKLL